MDESGKKFIQEENEKLAGLFSRSLTEMRENLKQDITNLEEKMDAKFEKVDERFEKIDKQFEKVDERFDNLEVSIGKRHQEIDELRDRTILIERKVGIR